MGLLGGREGCGRVPASRGPGGRTDTHPLSLLSRFPGLNGLPPELPLGGGFSGLGSRARLRAAVTEVVSVGLTGLDEMGLIRRSALMKGGGSVCFDLSGQVDL